MTTEAQLAEARRAVENEDYLPWQYVQAAKNLLGIQDAEHVVEVVIEVADCGRPYQ